MPVKQKTKSTKESPIHEKTHSRLPSVQKLVQDAWELFKKTLITYLKLVGIAIAYVLLALLIGVVIALPITFYAFGSHFQLFKHLTPFHIVTLVLLSVWFILFFLSLIALEVIFPIASILVLQEKKAESIVGLVKQSLSFFWPYLLTLLLSNIVALGGTILLVLPGLLIALFFVFVTFEVVVGGKSGTTALQRSYYLVKTHFWEVFGRLLLLEIGILVIASLLHSITSSWLVQLISFLFSLFSGWYARSYIYLLYTQIRERTTFPQSFSLRWVWVVSGIGWIVIILLLVWLVSGGAGHLPWMSSPIFNRSGYAA